MLPTFDGNPSATIISSYSPTNISEETELIVFYDELSSLVGSIPRHNVLVIGGDMNAQIEKNGNHKFSPHNSSNRNGLHLTDFTMKNELTCLNTNFQKRGETLDQHICTQYKSTDRLYVFMNKKWNNSALNCSRNPAT